MSLWTCQLAVENPSVIAFCHMCLTNWKEGMDDLLQWWCLLWYHWWKIKCKRWTQKVFERCTYVRRWLYRRWERSYGSMLWQVPTRLSQPRSTINKWALEGNVIKCHLSHRCASWCSAVHYESMCTNFQAFSTLKYRKHSQQRKLHPIVLQTTFSTTRTLNGWAENTSCDSYQVFMLCGMCAIITSCSAHRQLLCSWDWPGSLTTFSSGRSSTCAPLWDSRLAWGRVVEKFPEGSECDAYIFYGISCLNPGKLKQVAIAVNEDGMRWILLQETLHTIVYTSQRKLLLHQIPHPWACWAVYVFFCLFWTR